MTADEIWRDMLAGTDILKSRPNFRYDPVFCANYYPDFFAGRPWLIKTLEKTVMVGKRGGNAYQMLTSRIPNIDRAVTELVTDPRLRRAIDDGVEDAHELVFELISLGEPIDREISSFSQDHYFTAYPDIARSGVAGLRHFVQSGMAEGRHSLRDVLENQHKGAVAFDPAKPTCLICTHDLTKTGAPIVGLTLARKASLTHIVVGLALRPGVLLKPFLDTTVGVFVSPNLDGDLEYCSLIDIETVDFAILNSVETYPFAKALVRRDVPFATYLHEFADYTQPPSKMIFLALFSDLLVFSSQIVRDSWRDIFRSMSFDEAADSMILPQAELQIGSVSQEDQMTARARLSQLLGVDCSQRRIIYGAGYAHWRKGTDLFVLTAQMARQQDPDTLFVWVGDGQDHEDIHFGVWLDKHLREAKANTSDGNLFFLPAGDHYLDICKAADAFYLCSRLDPLPNVIFDAVKFGGRAVIYKHASGFDDPVYLNHDLIETVPYGDIAAASTALLSVPLKQPSAAEFSDAKPQGDIFQSITTALQDKLAGRPAPITQMGDYDVAVMFSPDVADQEARIKERQKLWSYGRSFVWKSMEEAQTTLAASDNWMHAASRIERFAHLGDAGGLDFSIHMHAHYIDNLAHDFAQYKALKEARDIVVTTDNDEKAARISDMAEHAGIKARTRVVPNKGRDILPFMQLFADGQADARDIWCHVHQKKSVGTSHSGEVWHAFLMAILLGDRSRVSSALDHMRDQTTGLVAPFDPYWCDWAGSRRLLPTIASKLPGPAPEHLLLFPVGNMFWTKGAVVDQMNGLFDPGYPWPNEPLPSDGTVFHLIERLWPAASAMAGLSTVFLEKTDQQRT